MYVDQFLKQQRQARQAEKVRNATLLFLKTRSTLLTDTFPVIERSGIDWTEYIVEQADPVASIVAPGQEYPNWQGNEFTQMIDRLPKAALSYFWNEDTLRKAKEVGEYSGNVMGGGAVDLFAPNLGEQLDLISPSKVTENSKYENLVRLLFGSEQQLIRAHFNIIDIMAYQLLQTGEINYRDARTNRVIRYNWKGVTSSEYDHFPDSSPTATFLPNGTKNIAGHAVKDWSNWATADGLEDLQAAARVYHGDSGKYPDIIQMSSLLAYNLLRQEATKKAVVDTSIVGELLRGSPTMGMVNSLLKSKSLPEIVINDDQFTFDEGNTGNSRNRQRFLDPTVFIFATKGMGERVFGGVMENGDKGGIYINTYEKSKNPPCDVTASASSPLAVCSTISRTGLCRKVTTQTKLDENIDIAAYLRD